jgi:hypothetical protein
MPQNLRYQVGEYAIILTNGYLQVSNKELYPTISLRLPIPLGHKLESVVVSENEGFFESNDLTLIYSKDRLELTHKPKTPGHVAPWIGVFIGIPKDVIDVLCVIGKSINADSISKVHSLLKSVKQWEYKPVVGGKNKTRKNRMMKYRS